MKNVNKNANHMLITTHDSYLVHSCFSEFSLDGNVPFTIEVEFAFQNCDHGSFYSQDNGFDLGFKNSLPYFSHPVLGNLNTPKTLTLETSCCYSLAVVYDKSTLKMYINGCETASVNTSGIGEKNTGDFYIGKEFNGFIGGVRVLPRAMTAEELIKENGQGFQNDDNCELWTDFSGIGYKDIGKNKISLWRTGIDANCANVVNCTALYRNGLYMRTNSLDYDTAFSLTGKIYPDISPTGNFNIYTLYEGSSGEEYLRLYLEDRDGACYLTANVGGNVLTSKTKVQGMLWTDYAITVDIKNGNVHLYQDGEECTKDAAYSGIKPFKNAKAVIGGKSFTGRPDYSDAFNGLLDYCAEFNRELKSGEVKKYMEDQPYLYENGLCSLMYFGWGDAEDVFENTPLSKYGGGYFTMVADTNKVTDPIGLNWYIPEDGKAYWDSLSEYDRWDFQTKILIIQKVVEGLTGIPMNSGNESFKRPLSKPMEKILRELPTAEFTEDKSYNKELEYKIIIAATGAILLSFCILVILGLMGNRLAARGTCLRWFALNWDKAAAAITAVITLVAGIIVTAIEASQADRPPNDNAKLRVKSFLWDHNGDPKTGSIHFHTESGKQYYKPDKMAFEPDSKALNICGVFVPTKLEELVMDIEVENTDTNEFSGEIVLLDHRGKKMGKSSTVVIKADGKPSTVSVHIPASSVKMLRFGRVKNWFEIKYSENGNDTYVIRCEYTVYTMLGEPITPWNNTKGEYDINNHGYVHTSLLDVCLDTFKIKLDEKQQDNDELIKSIINGMNSCGKLTYESEGGESKFTVIYDSPLMLLFKFIKFFHLIQKSGSSDLNCMDCAVIVSSLCAMHGKKYPMLILDNGPFGFVCNEVQLISSKTPEWVKPFGTGMFSFHMVNRDDTDSLSCDTLIYDACLKLDGGKHPGWSSKEYTKTPCQPLGMKACETYDAVHVDPNDEYKKEIYRERLVANGESAGFVFSNYYVSDVSALENNIDNIKLMKASWIEQVFGSNKHISQLTLVDDMYGELDWSFIYDGEFMEICCCAIENFDDPRQAVENIIKWYTNPNKTDVSESYPGSCCYKITERAYILWKDGKVYKIHGVYAKEVADYIYRA